MHPRKAALALALLVTGLFAFLFLRGQRWDEIGALYAGVNLWYLGGSVLALMATFVMRTLQWGVLLRSHKRLPLTGLLGATLIGFAANNLLPLRAGEIIRPAVIRVRYNESFAVLLATIAVERVMDLLGLAAMLLAIYVFWPGGGTAGSGGPHLQGGVAAAFLALAFAVLAVALTRYPEAIKRVVRWGLGLFPEWVGRRAEAAVDAFGLGLGVLVEPWRVVAVLLLSLAIWATVTWSMLLCAQALGMQLSFIGACFSVFVVALAIALPQGPAYVGTYHFAAQWSMQVLGHEQSVAAAYAILSHAVVVLPVVVGGLIAMWAMGLSVPKVREAAEGEERR